MAKKKKNQDTSPLAMGRQQKGSAANKKMTGSQSGSQSSSYSNKGERITSTPKTSTIQRDQERGISRTASTNVSKSQSYKTSRTNNVSGSNDSDIKRYTPTKSAANRITMQDRQANNYGVSANQRFQNAASNNNLKQTQAQAARDRLEQQRIKNKEESEARRARTMANNNLKQTQAASSRQQNEALKNKINAKAREGQKQKLGLNTQAKTNLPKPLEDVGKALYHGAKEAVHELHGAAERGMRFKTTESGVEKAWQDKLGIVNEQQREKAKKRSELRQTAITEKIRKEQQKIQDLENRQNSLLGELAVGAASSAGGMLVDRLTGPMSLLTMGIRVTEGQLGHTKEKTNNLRKQLEASGQFSSDELDEMFKDADRWDVANALAGGSIEMLSEMMFGGIGLAAQYTGGKGVLDKSMRRLTGRLGRTAAGRTLLGIGEEVAEEEVGNPLQTWAANRLYGNKLQDIQEESIKRSYEASLDELKAASADVNSDAFLKKSIEVYKEAGASDEEAVELAELARGYFNASLEGRGSEADEYMSRIVDKLAGGENDLREKWTLEDALKVAGSTALMVGVTGGPGQINTSSLGNEYKANYGIKGVRNLAKVVENFDEDNAAKATAIIDAIDNDRNVTGTEVHDLMRWSNEAALKAQDREIARDRLVQKKMNDENLLVPIVDAEYNLAPATEQRFEDIAERTVDRIEGSNLNISEEDKYTVADVVAAFETGTISAEQTKELNLENPENRTAFTEMTGIDLNDYIVRDKKGNIDTPASNIKMQEALFAKASDNYIESARIEQQNWNDIERGQATEQLKTNMDIGGAEAVAVALNSVDPRDRGTFRLTGAAARRVYEYSRNTNDNWNDVKAEFKGMFKGVDESVMRDVFNAAKKDKEKAETAYYGKQVTKNSLNTKETSYVPGSFENKSERQLKNSELVTLTKAANELGINIVMSDDLAANVNGSYDKNSRTITLNAANTMGDSLGAIFSHEITHHLAVFAPDQYLKLSNLIMDSWYKSDEEGYKAALKAIQGRYKEAKGQELSPEQALEELIADNAIDIWNDKTFADSIAAEDVSLAQAIINAIKDVLAKLRNILSGNSVTDPETRDNLFVRINAYDEAYKLWTRAYDEAVRAKSDEAFNNFADELIAGERYSLEPRSMADRYEEGYKLSHKQFNRFYSAHKLNYGGEQKGNLEDTIKNIKENGFTSRTSLSNVVPAGINDYTDPEKPTYTEGLYGSKEGDTVLLVPKTYLDEKNDRIKQGFIPRDYEIVTVERDYQPYYELYEKAYDNTENSDIRYSLGSESDIMNTLEDNFNEYKEDKTNLRIAAEALNDLQHSRYSISEDNVFGRWDGGVQVRTLAKGITTTLLNEGRVDFRGQKVKSPEDLARLCQVLRDPRYETFRLVLTKGDKIVSFRSISSRLPGLSSAFELDDVRESIDIVRDRMNRLGADGYYLIHNHPSGDVNASFEDLNVTRAYLALLGQDTYKGHIILDHDEFGYIDADIPQEINGNYYPTPRIEPIEGQQTLDFIHEPEIDHAVLGSMIKDSKDVARVAQTINSTDGISVLLYTSTKAEVRGVQEISNKALKNNKEISGYIRNQAVDEFGSSGVFLYTTDLDTYNASKELIKSGHLVDSVIGYGPDTKWVESGRQNVAEPGKIGMLGLTEKEDAKRKSVFESANPDIRYSFSDEDDALSSIAYTAAEDDSIEALQRYEQMIGSVDAETYNIKPLDEEAVSKFFAALNYDETVIPSDPVAKEDRNRIARSKADFYSSMRAKWNERWHTDGEVLDIKSVKTDIRNLIMGVMANSDTTQKYKTGLVNKTLMDVRTAYQLMKQDRTEVASYLLYHSALRMISDAEFYVDDGINERYKELREFFRTQRISLGEEYWSDVDFGAFRKNNFGRMRLVKGKTNVDQIYQELCELFPEYFNEEENWDVPSMLEQMAHVLDTVQPLKEAYSSEAATELAYDIADELYEIMVSGKEVESLADRYRDRYNAKTQAMKQRHEEAINKIKQQTYKEIKAERAKWQAKEEQKKERQQHVKTFGKIQENYDWLKDRLLSNTADKHIPEKYKKELAGLLAAFDMQTVGSKKRQARTGYKAKKTLQMNALRAGLEKMHNAYDSFYVHDAITDLIEHLAETVEGKTIDELATSELTGIDNLMRMLRRSFTIYEEVRVGNKKAEVSGLGRSQIDSDLTHAEKFGAGKDYQDRILKPIDMLLNLDELTPAYLFRRIDPNESGIGLVWKEIRRGFDNYIRNQNQLNDWMQEIVGQYHQKGLLWNKYGSGELTKWRSINYAQQFKLQSGHVIELTPAQMMSIYCLRNRYQAYTHMIGDGIVVAPVKFEAVAMSDIKHKANTALPEQLTDVDLNNIIQALTPDQIKVAQKLQELMATKMADWGNEASMELLDIKLFREPDYYPIRTDRQALTKDLNDNEFVEAIRNFGFTKAVKPNAKNAIMVEDIFDVVTEHCNNMNLYNSYSVPINDFMKVYNFKDVRQDGSNYTVQQSISHAYSKKANTFIMTFLRELNGNVSGRASGIESTYNTLLANAKKAAVFANLRVAAQQPTAITRAFAEINPKYIKGIKISKGAMVEMFEHCPIALWKSWGFYDINMGKSIEDLIMNNGRWLEDMATDLYGYLDNVTWTGIWQMVKAEMKDTHPSLEEGTDEYWEACNERMSEIVDLTQVVDSPMHRSHAMRSKDFFHKTVTSFMAEPTLTFNVIKAGLVKAYELNKLGNKSEATKILSKTLSIGILQAATVASAAALVDALRKKNPDKDDDERYAHLWWVNALENFKDEINPLNKIYVFKDIASIFEGWENSNLALQGIQKISLGFRQIKGDPYARSSLSWWQNMADGVGYLSGVPVKTVRTGITNAMNQLGVRSPILEQMGDSLDSLAPDKKETEIDEGGFFGKLLTLDKKESADDEEGSSKSSKKKKTSSSEVKLTAMSYDERVAYLAAHPTDASDEEAEKLIKISEKAAEQKGNPDALWDIVSDGYTKKVNAADYGYIDKIRRIYIENGGDGEAFDAKIVDASKTALKKSINYDASDSDIDKQARIQDYLLAHGMTEKQISSEVVYKSNIAKDLKVAFNLNDEELMWEALDPLIQAGLTYDDMVKLYENRNRIKLDSYDGRFKDKLKSTGHYIWPTEGVITSEFGYRDAPTAGASTNHPAIDIGAPAGSPVIAADGGTVISAGWAGGYGKQVTIQHDDGTITYYSHLSWWDANVGDTVAQGQEIGKVGSTGNSTGPHLDFKVEINGEPVNPIDYLESKDVKYDLGA